jgi:hypothetical protein
MHGKPRLWCVVFGSVSSTVTTVIQFFLYSCCLKALTGPDTSLEWLILLHTSQGWQQDWRLWLWYQKRSQCIPYTWRGWTEPGIPCCSKLQHQYQVLGAGCHVSLLRHLLLQTTKKQVKHSTSVSLTYMRNTKAGIDSYCILWLRSLALQVILIVQIHIRKKLWYLTPPGTQGCLMLFSGY